MCRYNSELLPWTGSDDTLRSLCLFIKDPHVQVLVKLFLKTRNNKLFEGLQALLYSASLVLWTLQFFPPCFQVDFVKWGTRVLLCRLPCLQHRLLAVRISAQNRRPKGSCSLPALAPGLCSNEFCSCARKSQTCLIHYPHVQGEKNTTKNTPTSPCQKT